MKLLHDLPPWLLSAILLSGAVVVAFVAHYAVFRIADRIERYNAFGEALFRHTRRPSRALLPLIAAIVVLPATHFPARVESTLQHIVSLGLIAAMGWLSMAFVDIAVDLAAGRYRIGSPDNLRARKIFTQLQLLRRIALIAVSIIALSLMLMTFPGVERLGATLFASAGVAGLVIGIAARPTLSNIIAGVQIALTEPIRIDDVVVVDGEWGRIEEIGAAYVVVRIWDLRRLVLPLSYFIEKPFQNWTRRTADILGTVFLYADYTLPVQAVREELFRVLQSSKQWDGKTWGLQVTNATEHAMELRALMSAADSSQAWDLRCYVREQLIRFLQETYPDSLPRTRAEWLPQPPLEQPTGPLNNVQKTGG